MRSGFTYGRAVQMVRAKFNVENDEQARAIVEAAVGCDPRRGWMPLSIWNEETFASQLSSVQALFERTFSIK